MLDSSGRLETCHHAETGKGSREKLYIFTLRWSLGWDEEVLAAGISYWLVFSGNYKQKPTHHLKIQKLACSDWVPSGTEIIGARSIYLSPKAAMCSSKGISLEFRHGKTSIPDTCVPNCWLVLFLRGLCSGWYVSTTRLGILDLYS